jgi:hypothetical protein
MAAHSWETAATAHSWSHLDDPDEVGGFWGECSDDDFESETPDTPGSKLVSLLLEHMLHSRISSLQCCTLMHWAEKAGVTEAKAYATQPNTSGGHASRKLRAALGHVACTDLYEADVPGHSRHDLERTTHVVSFLPMHEQIAKSLRDTPGSLTKLAELKATGDLPRAYVEHPVVLGNPDEPVIPIAIFMDAVPYSHTDSVLGCWGLNVLTGERFLFAVVRKRNICRCGCKGWCTYHVVFEVAAWSLSALAKKEWPHERHTGDPWLPSDTKRASMAGEPLPHRCACIYVKGDWAEYSHTFGLPAWNDGLRACFACAGCGPDLFVHAGNGPESLRWHCNSPGDYAAACDRCEHRVTITTVAQRARLAGLLRWDKRIRGGRCLARDVPEFGLLADDRLEPSRGCPDVGAFASLHLPVEVVFWRRTDDSLTRHRNPLFREDLGVSAEVSMTIDTLHALYLGVMLVWCRTVVWALLLSGVYGATGTSDAGLTVCCLAMRASLFAWYRARHALFPTEFLTRVSDWTPSMVGSNTKRKCKTKAAETWSLLLFLLDELRRFTGSAGNDWQRLLKAGVNLEAMVVLWRGSSWKMSPPSIQAGTRFKKMPFLHYGVAYSYNTQCYTIRCIILKS